MYLFSLIRREPANLIKPPKKKANNPADVTEENLQKHTAKANRHLLLVRHGQYFIKEPEEDKKTLTELGKKYVHTCAFYITIRKH